jgi:glutathione S-transferase
MELTATQVYVLTTVVLVLNMLGLWIYSGTVRGKTKTTPNEEDARTILKGSRLEETDPPEVRRALRAHANAVANIVPFLFIAYLYVTVAAPKAMTALIVCGVFVLARLGHSFAYLNGKQPWRSMAWGVGLLVTLVTVVLLLIGAWA